MAEVLRLHGLGAVVEVRCTGSEGMQLASAMRPVWSRCLHPDEPATELVQAAPIESRVDDSAQLARVLMTTTQRVTRALITARAGHLLMFHAGAVSDPHSGRSLVYVAEGGTGKTTMSRLLGRRLGYVTDETVGIDTTGRILPYPKPLSVRRPDGQGLKDEISPDALGLMATPTHAQASRIVLLDRRQEGADEITEVPFMDALVELVGQSSSLPRLARPLHQLADLLDDTGPVLKLRYTEATQPEDKLVALVAGWS